MSELVLFVGAGVLLLVVSGVKAVLQANARINADVEFLRSIPAGMEWGQ